MASVQARHSRNCALGGIWTPANRTGAKSGCTCRPSFYVVLRDEGRLVRERIGKNRRQAEAMRDKRAVELHEGAYLTPSRLTFAEWGDVWLRLLDRQKATTRKEYASSVEWAKRAFGNRLLRQLRPLHIGELNQMMRNEGLSSSTRNKHVRALATCLESAVRHGHLPRNPVRDLPHGERPRPERKEAAYFEQAELPQLFAHVHDPLYRTLLLTALKTGMRQGELVALTWGDVDLGAAVIRVRRSFTLDTVTEPKMGQRRDVDLSRDVVELLGEWWGESGRPGDAALVFPNTTRGYLNTSNIRNRKLYPAMEAAGIPRLGPTGENRTFHSFRHTFAKRALETGRSLTWLSRHLGHSSLAVTTEIYGHFERAERKRQIAEMAGQFGV